MPAITTLTAKQVRKSSTKRLTSLHLRTHQLASHVLGESSDQEKKGKLTRQQLLHAHRLIAAEMKRRGLLHDPHDRLDFLSARTPSSQKDDTKEQKKAGKVRKEKQARPAGSLLLVIGYGGERVLARMDEDGSWSPIILRKAEDIRKAQRYLERLGLTEVNHIACLPPLDVTKAGINLRPLVFDVSCEEDGLLEKQPELQWLLPEEVAQSELAELWWSALMLRRKSDEPQYRQEALATLHAALPQEFVLNPRWLSISGGFVYARDRDPNDLDVICRNREALTPGSLLKVERLLSFLSGKQVHWVDDAAGPSWASLPLYDLVARKRPWQGIEEVDEPEFAAMMYKAELVHSWQGIKPGKPLAHYKAGGEFYRGDEKALWDKFVQPAIARGKKIAVQQKYDGFRLMIHVEDSKISVFSDSGYDRIKVFPDLESVLPQGSFILDCEFMQLEHVGGKPVERWKMAWMGSADQRPQPAPPILIAVHDMPYYEGKNISQEPYQKRLEQLKKLLGQGRKQGNYRLLVAETRIVDSRDELDKAIKWASSQSGSEGAMLKLADFKYDPGRLATVVKFKNATEVDARIIGYRKLPKPKPAGVHWTRQQALSALPKLLKESNTYIFRIAVMRQGKLMAVESDARLTAADLKLDWDEKRQRYTGTDDPRLWTMWHGMPERKAGQYKYGNTYALRVEPGQLKPGVVVTIAPMKARLFRHSKGSDEPNGGSLGLAFMFPRAKQIKPRGSGVSSLENVIKAFGLSAPTGETRESRPVEKGVRQLFGSPGGKGAVARHIVAMIPPHKTYVEPFAGGAAVFFAKEPSPREVLSDIDGRIIAAYRTVQHLSDQGIKKLQSMNWRYRDFDKVKASSPSGRLGKLHRFLLMRIASYGNLEETKDTGRLATSPDIEVKVASRLPQVRKRLHGATLLHQDYRATLRQFDAPDTFFFLDPPYPDTNRGSSQKQLRWTQKDLEQLAQAVKTLKGKWLLTVHDTSDNRKLFSGFHIRRITLGRQLDQGGDQTVSSQRGGELLISNFTPTSRLRKARINALNPAFYPSEKGRPFVAQIHFRGRSAHLDLRFSIGQVLEGWTVAVQQPEAIKQPVESLQQARKLWAQNDIWKLDPRTGAIRPRQVQTRIAGQERQIVRPGALRALPKKAEIPADWIGVQGVTERADPGEATPTGATKNFPGVFLIVDRGQVHLGARRPWFFEYFLEGKHFKGRYLFRLVSRKEKAEPLPPGQREARPRGSAYWVMMKAKDERPYVLSNEAIKKGWLPPKGISALPPRLRKRVPADLRYWQAEGKEAQERRKALAEKVEELGGPELSKAESRFVLQRHFWRGQIVIRFGPSTEHYDLRISEARASSTGTRGEKYFHMVMDGDPRQGEVAGYKKTMTDDSVTDDQGKIVQLMDLRDRIRLKPGTAANPTKSTPAFLETLDHGTVTWLEREADRIKLRLQGKKGAITLFLKRENKDSPFWSITPSQGPKVEKSWHCRIEKLDEERHLVYGIVLRPKPFVDSQQDMMEVDEIERAAHRFLIGSRAIDLEHREVLPSEKARPVESYIAPHDLHWRVNGATKTVPAGSWVLVTHVPDEQLWQRIKAGELNAYSIRGFGVRKELHNAQEARE